MARRSSVWCILVLFAVVSALCISSPALYWKFKKGFKLISTPCSPCFCDCPPPLSILKISPGLANLSVTDCGKDDPDIKEEMEKPFVDLLTEELKLLKTVDAERRHHMNITFEEGKRLASLYQTEAEKCNIATETCEAAREHAEALLTKEKKKTSAWEKRAHQMGWKSE